jgi:hypothetical protein
MMEESLFAAMQVSIARTDELHAQHIAELERTVAALHEVLRVMATQALQLADLKPPSDPVDAAVVESVLDQARKAMEILEPPSH